MGATVTLEKGLTDMVGKPIVKNGKNVAVIKSYNPETGLAEVETIFGEYVFVDEKNTTVGVSSRSPQPDRIKGILEIEFPDAKIIRNNIFHYNEYIVFFDTTKTFQILIPNNPVKVKRCEFFDGTDLLGGSYDIMDVSVDPSFNLQAVIDCIRNFKLTREMK